jgi:hypothetical protein
MEPTEAILTALAIGAKLSQDSGTEQQLKRLYGNLKSIVISKYKSINEDIEFLEAKPSSKARQEMVHDDLIDYRIGQDMDVLSAAKELLFEIQEEGKYTEGQIGVDLQDVSAESLTVSDIISTGTGIFVKRAKIKKDIIISKIKRTGYYIKHKII